MKNIILPVVIFLLAAGSTFAQGKVDIQIRPTVVLNGEKAQHPTQRPPMRHDNGHHYGHHKHHHHCGHVNHTKPQPPHHRPAPHGPMRGPRR